MVNGLDKLINYAYRRYSEPKIWWSKAHFRKRSDEIYTIDILVSRCMDCTDFETSIMDILEDYLYELEFSLIRIEDPNKRGRVRTSINVIKTLMEKEKYD